MRTDQLIDSLAANLRPVDRGRVSRRFRIALAIGLAAALGEMFLLIGPYQGLDGRGLVGVFSQLLFALGIAATAAVFLFRSVHPGTEVPRFSCIGFFSGRCDRGIRRGRACVNSPIHLSRHDCRQ